MSPPEQQQIQIRLATAGDASQIYAVLFNSFIEFEPLYTPKAFAATVPAEDQIQGRLSEGPTWLALRHKAIVGTVSAVITGDAVYIRSMAVDPSARGKGIGHKLLQAVEAFALQEGLKRLLLSTTPFLERAIKLYKNNEFSRSSEGPTDLFGTPLFTMIKILPEPATDPNESQPQIATK